MEIGDQVEAIDDVISGVIVAVNKHRITIETIDGFEIEFDQNELVAVDKHFLNTQVNFKDFNKQLAEKQSAKRKKMFFKKNKEKSIPPMEVDLHIHQLTASNQRMSNHEMLTLQIETAQRQLDFAIKKRIQKIVFIHGVGEGVLKTELEYLFKRYDNIKYYDADYQKYGRGATEIYIFQNKKN